MIFWSARSRPWMFGCCCCFFWVFFFKSFLYKYIYILFFPFASVLIRKPFPLATVFCLRMTLALALRFVKNSGIPRGNENGSHHTGMKISIILQCFVFVTFCTFYFFLAPTFKWGWMVLKSSPTLLPATTGYAKPTQESH